jgi:Periplasmic component of the Tol biopolymer transport system
MNNDGENKTCLITSSEDLGDSRMPFWAGASIFHIRYLKDVYSSEVFSMNPNGENTKRLTHNQATDYYPRTSIGGKIIFTSEHKLINGAQIWSMGLDGSDLKQLTDTQGYSCAWSPDGKYIVYTDSRRENGRLWVMDGDGKNKRQLTFVHHF